MVSSEIDEAEKNPYEIYLAAGGIVFIGTPTLHPLPLPDQQPST